MLVTMSPEASVEHMISLVARLDAAQYAEAIAWYPVVGQAVADHGARYGKTPAQSWIGFATLSARARVKANWDMFHVWLTEGAYAKMRATNNQRMSLYTLALPLSDTEARSLLSGPKVTPFAANLSGDMSQLTLDRHAFRAPFGYDPEAAASLPVEWNPTVLQRRFITACYVQTATLLGVPLATAQALVWYGQGIYHTRSRNQPFDTGVKYIQSRAWGVL